MKNESKSKYLQHIAINLLHRFNVCFFVEFFVIPFMVMPIKIFTHDNIFHYCNTEAHQYIHPLVVFIQITDHKAVTTVQKNKIVHRVKTTFQILKTFLRGFDLLIISEIPSL